MRPPREVSNLARRDFLRTLSGASAALLLPGPQDATAEVFPRGASVEGGARAETTPADVTLRIGTVLVEVTKDWTISTTGYNGSVPAPLIRLREGVPVTVEISNHTDTPEYVHWHGQTIPADVDGAPEEKSLVVPAHGHLRYRLVPAPRGMRFVHTHVVPGPDLHRGTYTGQFGIVYIEPRNDPAAWQLALSDRLSTVSVRVRLKNSSAAWLMPRC